MSTRGLSARVSARIQTIAKTAAAAKSPSVRGESQPQLDASLIARRKHISQSERKTAPAQLMLPGARTGDSGTRRMVATMVSVTTPNGIQNSQW